MCAKVSKNVIKEYFRSGKRPNQAEFHTLIDNAYNAAFSSAVSGYSILTDMRGTQAFYMISRTQGKTFLVPAFKPLRLNSPYNFVYHYAIPLCNIGPDLNLTEVQAKFNIPAKIEYTIEEKGNRIAITLTAVLEKITLYNGDEEIYNVKSEEINQDSGMQLALNINAAGWYGIGIDLFVRYKIESDKAISNETDIIQPVADKVLNAFGAASCSFNEGE